MCAARIQEVVHLMRMRELRSAVSFGIWWREFFARLRSSLSCLEMSRWKGRRACVARYGCKSLVDPDVV